MFFIYAHNFSSIDDDHKEISLSKKIEAKTLDTWISFNRYSNELKFLSHIYSLMIYKIPKFQIQKNSNKGDMTKKPDLTQNLQKLTTLTKHILFSLKFENTSVL